ncbi:hypothetical protein V6U81_17975 [Micromonospora sp. CPCC 205711]|uniref:hypothetical protein n=1 Tax=Micromonospora sp. CPCC 205547 TaxID=3122400 RepID=UPI002FF30215
MARPTQKHAVLKVAGIGAFAALLLGAGLQLASADENAAATPVSVSCPGVADQLGAVPAAAQNGVNQELRNLELQIANANARLARGPKQAQNQLNDIAGKRRAVLDRIRLDITRVGGAAPAGLERLAGCSLASGAGGADAGNAQNTGNGNAGVAGAQTVNCPSVRDKLADVPAAAAAGVEKELANLDGEIANANARLARLAVKPEGGPNFVQNAILGPLRNKRIAVLDRIGIDINRAGGQRPDLSALAACTLNAPGAASPVNGSAGAGTGNAGTGNAGTGVARTVSCPSVQDRLPAVPAQAAGQVRDELANLQRQIDEANARLARLAVRPEGGPNFIQNAILGPLEDKRIAVLNRIATDIGRVDGNRPAELVDLATCTLN